MALKPSLKISTLARLDIDLAQCAGVSCRTSGSAQRHERVFTHPLEREAATNALQRESKYRKNQDLLGYLYSGAALS
jgi:hypothetical protein